MKFISLIVAVVMALACVANTGAFVMPRVGAAGSAARVADQLAPSVSQLTSSRPSGEIIKHVSTLRNVRTCTSDSVFLSCGCPHEAISLAPGGVKNSAACVPCVCEV